MKDPGLLWETWNIAKTFSCRPSELLSIEDNLVAYYIDRSTFIFGIGVENRMDEAEENTKSAKAARAARQRVLDGILKKNQTAENKKFREPPKPV